MRLNTHLRVLFSLLTFSLLCGCEHVSAQESVQPAKKEFTFIYFASDGLYLGTRTNISDQEAKTWADDEILHSDRGCHFSEIDFMAPILSGGPENDRVLRGTVCRY